MDEDVGDAVRVAVDQVRRVRDESHVAAVGADRGPVAVAVSLPSRARHAHPRRRALPRLPDEDVPHSVRVAVDEVGGDGVEGNRAPVGADRGLLAGSRASRIRLLTRRRDARACGLSARIARERDARRRRDRKRDHACDHSPVRARGLTQALGRGQAPC